MQELTIAKIVKNFKKNIYWS